MSDSLKSILPASLFEEFEWKCRICRPGSGNYPYCECRECPGPYGGKGGWNRLGYKFSLLYQYLLEIIDDLDMSRKVIDAVRKAYPESFKDGVNTVFTIEEYDFPNPPKFVQSTLMNGILDKLGFDELSLKNLLALGAKSASLETVERYCRDYDYRVVRMLLTDPVVQTYRSEDSDVNGFLNELKEEAYAY